MQVQHWPRGNASALPGRVCFQVWAGFCGSRQAYEESRRNSPGLLLGSISGAHMIIAAVCPIAAVPSEPILADLGCMENAYHERAGAIWQE